MNISEYLARRNVHFERLEHTPTYSARQMAQTIHVSGRQVAKTVLLRLRPGTTRYVVAILPANAEVDLQKLAAVLDTPKVELAMPVELGWRFPDCELGVVPPFASEYEMRTVVDESLARNQTIAFEGTKHAETIQMRYEDFKVLENPLVAEIAKDALHSATHDRG